MEHAELRKKLSAYLDKATTAAERLEIEEHLSRCPDCRDELVDLEKTVGHLRQLPGVEPPVWLTAKIMARVREEAEAKPSLWQRLFVPLRVKLPLEAVALIFLCVTGYYLARTMAPEVPVTAPPAAVEEKGAPRPQPPSPSVESRGEGSKPVQPPPPPGQALSRQAPVQEREESPPAFAPAPPPVMESPRALPAAPRAEGAPAPAVRPALPAQDRATVQAEKSESEYFGASAAKKAKKAARSEEPPAAAGVGANLLPRVVLRVADAAVTEGELRQLVTAQGGSILRREETVSGSQLTVRIGVGRANEFFARLEKLGSVVRKPAAVDRAAGDVDVIVEIETAR
ncbi:MAG TPA: DUF2275 domain-containing protein [Geobacteraceae bacterium]